MAAHVAEEGDAAGWNRTLADNARRGYGHQQLGDPDRPFAGLPDKHHLNIVS